MLFTISTNIFTTFVFLPVSLRASGLTLCFRSVVTVANVVHVAVRPSTNDPSRHPLESDYIFSILSVLMVSTLLSFRSFSTIVRTSSVFLRGAFIDHLFQCISMARWRRRLIFLSCTLVVDMLPLDLTLVARLMTVSPERQMRSTLSIRFNRRATTSPNNS